MKGTFKTHLTSPQGNPASLGAHADRSHSDTLCCDEWEVLKRYRPWVPDDGNPEAIGSTFFMINLLRYINKSGLFTITFKDNSPRVHQGSCDKKNRLQDKEEKEIHQTKEIEGVDTLTSTRSEGSKETKINGQEQKRVLAPLSFFVARKQGF
jgi:hypothetical protein